MRYHLRRCLILSLRLNCFLFRFSFFLSPLHYRLPVLPAFMFSLFFYSSPPTKPREILTIYWTGKGKQATITNNSNIKCREKKKTSLILIKVFVYGLAIAILLVNCVYFSLFLFFFFVPCTKRFNIRFTKINNTEVPIVFVSLSMFLFLRLLSSSCVDSMNGNFRLWINFHRTIEWGQRTHTHTRIYTPFLAPSIARTELFLFSFLEIVFMENSKRFMSLSFPFSISFSFLLLWI